MPSSGRKAKSRQGLVVEKKQAYAARAVDQIGELLEDFSEWREMFAPILRKDLRAGLSPKELRTKYKSLAQAREIAIAIGDQDSGKALTAIKSIIDREEGRPTERLEHTHKLEKLPDEQLDAMLLSQLEQLEDETQDE